MNNLINKTKTSLGTLILVSLCLLVLSLVSISGVTFANNKNTVSSGRLVTIYDNGTEKTILTQALNVGDALKDAGISTDKNDVVEPAINEELISSSYQVNIYRARPVTVIDGNLRLKIFTAYQTPKQIAKDAGIILYSEDKTEFNLASNIIEGAGLEMVITRATPINVTLFGATKVIRTHGLTVNEMLQEKNIKLSSDDRLSVKLDDKIFNNMDIKIWREGKQTMAVDEEIEFDIQIIEDANQSLGYKDIRTPGEVGQRTVIYEILIQDDVEISRSEIASVVSKQPIKQIEVIGVRGKYNTPSENENITWEFLINQGFSQIQVAGIMGNLMQEHRFNTSDVAGGLGIAQWIGGRRANLMSMYPDSYTNIYSQLDYLMFELNGSYRSVRDGIKASSSLSEVVEIFQNQFERCNPKYCNFNNRLQYASSILGSH